MTPSEAIAQACAEIRATLSRLEASQRPSDVRQGSKEGAPTEAPTADPRLSFRDGTVCYWEVGTTKNGRPRARVGIEWRRPTSGETEREYFDCYEMKAVEKVDPLNKGDRVQLTLKPWQDKFIVTGITVVQRSELRRVSVPASSIEGLDEIPF